jgi:hypothetical protein
VPKEPEKPEGKKPDEAEEERPTVSPPFDPAEFARTFSARASPPKGVAAPRAQRRSNPTPLGLGAVRPPSPTLTDPDELEDARRRSMASKPASRKATPAGALSLVNAQVPSNLPPRRDSTDGLSNVDAEWEELATTPPPPDQQAIIDASARDEAPPASAKVTPPGIAKVTPPATAKVTPPGIARVTPPTTAKVTPQATARPPDLAKATPPAAAKAATPPPPPPPEPPITAQEMNDRVAVGDFTGALAIAEKLLAKEPDDEAVEACAEECRKTLRKMYSAKLGPLDRVPVVMVARDQLRWLSIDHRAGFVLSLIDGVSSLEMILDVTGMPQLDGLRILSELAQQRIIAIR